MEEKIPLTAAEWKIMAALWNDTPRTIMQLTHALQAETDWTRHTVISLLRRMEAKGTVRAQAEGRAKTFYPTVSRESVVLQQTQDLLTRLFDGKVSLMVSDLVAQEAISPEELAAIRRAIDDAEQNGGG